MCYRLSWVHLAHLLTCFNFYLDDRYQSVCVNGVCAQSDLVTFGFPQSSISGPQVFSYYTDEIPEIAELHGVSVSMYASDTQLYLSFNLSSPDSGDLAV